MGLVEVVKSEAGATPGASEELCGGGSGWQEGGKLCWQDAGGPCAKTETGQIKKKKAIFDSIRMSLRWVGQERYALV